MKIQKGISWNVLKLKQRSASQLHAQTFCTIMKQNFLFRLVENGLIPSFYVTAMIWQTKSTHQEDPRLKILHGLLDETIRCLREYIQGMKIKLVFNLDEVEMSEWEDRKIGRSEGKSNRPEDDGWSDDTSSHITKCEIWNVKCEMWNVKCEMWNTYW
jgi:hypothetical protein